MKFDKSLLRTVLFAVGVVALVIGIYQTLLFNDLGRNYWIFMVSMACWMPLLYCGSRSGWLRKLPSSKPSWPSSSAPKPPPNRPRNADRPGSGTTCPAETPAPGRAAAGLKSGKTLITGQILVILRLF